MSKTETPPFRLICNADVFRRVAIATASNDLRYFLTGVRAEAAPEGGVLLIATDGMILIAMRDPFGSVDGAATVSLEPAMLKAAAKMYKPFRLEPYPKTLVVSDGLAGLFPIDGRLSRSEDERDYLFGKLAAVDPSIDALQWRHVLIDAEFPDWRAVIRKAGSMRNSIPHFAPVNMQRLQKALFEHGNDVLSLAVGGNEYDPAMVCARSKSIYEATALVMPMVRADLPVPPPWWPMPAALKTEEPAE